MTSDSINIALTAEFLSQLACPACHGDLQLEGERVVCTACRREYPVIDGIPVLIVDRSELRNR